MPAGNRRLAQWRVTWLIEHSTSHQLLWCIDSFVLQNPPLRQAPNRCASVYKITMKLKTKMNYFEFSVSCIDKFYEKQDLFYSKHEIEKSTNWFYDQACGILTLTINNENINFRYKEIGTFSEIENTWKWSWDNLGTLDKVKSEVEFIKTFGEKNSYKKLVEGEFESDSEEGKTFLAIALSLLNGNGGYITSKDKLLRYLILFDEVSEEITKEEKSKFVDCGNHQRRRRAFVCGHLSKGSKNGFEEAFDTFENMEFEYEDDDFMAWCNQCEEIRIKYDGWNEESEKCLNMKLLCEKCYFEIKETNKK